MIQAQQFGQPPRVDLVTLVAFPHGGILSRIAHHQFRHVRLSKSYNQAAQVPSSNVTCKSPRSPSTNSRIALVFVSITHSITIFPASFLTAIEMLSLCTSIPIYFLSFNMRVLLSVGVDANDQNLLQRGALLYCVTQPPKNDPSEPATSPGAGGMAKSFFPEREKDTVRESQAQIGISGWNAQLLPDLCNSLDQQIG